MRIRLLQRKPGFRTRSFKPWPTAERPLNLAERKDLRNSSRYNSRLIHKVDDDLFAAARAAFGDKRLVDMIILAGCYFLVCSVLNAFDVPVLSRVDRDAKEERQ
jgi:hypothetical protein